MVSEEELQLTTSSHDDKYSLVTDEAVARRQVHIIDEVTDVTFEQVKNLYDQMIEEDSTKPVHFIIGTAGGDVRSMLGIMNLMLLSKAPCYTYLLGETCSAGAWIYLCGHKRFAPETNLVSFMLHPMEWNRSDSLGNHDSHNKYVEKLSQQLIKLTASRTKLSIQKLRKLATTETCYFVGEELFEHGIATDVLNSVVFWHSEKPVKKEKKEKPQPLMEQK
jgi:ATP-dependent protease ClpP protease subunit